MDLLHNHALNEVASTHFDRWWQSPGAWVEPANQRRGGESGVRLLEPRDPSHRPLYCKRQSGHTYRSLRHPLGRPTVLREIKAYRAFARIGLKTPTIVYCAARQHQGQWQALLVTEALQGFVSLEQWYAGAPGAECRHAVLPQVAATLARLHQAGWQHGCCYPKHIFVKTQTDQEGQSRVEIALLDLEKSRRRWRTLDAARHDLRQLKRHRGPIPEADLTVLLQAYQAAVHGPLRLLQP